MAKKKKSKIEKVLKKATKNSRWGYLGGIPARIVLFVLSVIMPMIGSIAVFALVIVLMSGSMVAFIELDPNIGVTKEDVQGDTSNSGGNASRSVDVPDELKGKLLIPAGTVYTSSFGYRSGFSHKHIGIDISGDINGYGNIKPVYPGEVVNAEWHEDGVWGYVVVLKHNVEGTTMYSVYAHMKELKVSKGDVADFTTTLGIMGDEGASKGTHLHLELHDKTYDYENKWRNENNALDPNDYIACGEGGDKIKKTSWHNIQYCIDYREKVVGSW